MWQSSSSLISNGQSITPSQCNDSWIQGPFSQRNISLAHGFSSISSGTFQMLMMNGELNIVVLWSDDWMNQLFNDILIKWTNFVHRKSSNILISRENTYDNFVHLIDPDNQVGHHRGLMTECIHRTDIAIVQVDILVENRYLLYSYVRPNRHGNLVVCRIFDIRVYNFRHYMWIRLTDRVVLKILTLFTITGIKVTDTNLWFIRLIQTHMDLCTECFLILEM